MALTIKRTYKEILMDTGLTEREVREMKDGIDYLIYDKYDFVMNFKEYTEQCDIDEKIYLLDLIFGNTVDGNEKYTRIDYPYGEGYIIQFIL